MQAPILVDRSPSQPQSGLQRFARGITAALPGRDRVIHDRGRATSREAYMRAARLVTVAAFNPRLSASIAETVPTLLDDPAPADVMRKAGAALAAKFIWSRVADALAAVAAKVAPVASKASLELVA